MAFSFCFVFFFFLPTEEDHHIHHGQKELVVDESIVKVKRKLELLIKGSIQVRFHSEFRPAMRRSMFLLANRFKSC